MTSVTLMCIATAADESPATVISYHWNVINCYDDTGDYPCFYSQNQTSQNITNDLRAQDAGTVSCTVTINGTNYTSDPLTLRISGELYIMKHLLLSILAINNLPYHIGVGIINILVGVPGLCAGCGMLHMITPSALSHASMST